MKKHIALAMAVLSISSLACAGDGYGGGGHGGGGYGGGGYGGGHGGGGYGGGGGRGGGYGGGGGGGGGHGGYGHDDGYYTTTHYGPIKKGHVAGYGQKHYGHGFSKSGNAYGSLYAHDAAQAQETAKKYRGYDYKYR